MKTNLYREITTIEEAKQFLDELFQNGEHYHPEDDAHDIEWELKTEDQPTGYECDRLNDLMFAIYELPGNDDVQNMAFDPCGYLLDLIQPEHKTEWPYNQ